MESDKILLQHLLTTLTQIRNNLQCQVFDNHKNKLVQKNNAVTEYLKASAIDTILQSGEKHTYLLRDFQSYLKIVRLFQCKQ